MALLASAMLAGAPAAMASGSHNAIYVSGNSTFSDCGMEGSDFGLLMTGDLEGCLSIFIQGFSCKPANGFVQYIERGREVFVGTFRGKPGSFNTTYVVNAAYAEGFCESFDFSLELSGSCTHKVSGKSGVFRGAEGVLTLFDVITGMTGDPATGEFTAGYGANNFLYAGPISFRRDLVSLAAPAANAEGPQMARNVDGADSALRTSAPRLAQARC
jgi:hypothetical protein